MTKPPTPTVALIAPGRDMQSLADALRRKGVPNAAVWPRDDITDAELAVLWNHPPNITRSMPRLKGVMSLGAGADFIVNDHTIDADLPIGRVAGDAMAQRMAAYLLACVLSDCRQLDRYAMDQKARRWRPEPDNAEPSVGFLGAGTTARAAIRHFTQLGFQVSTWSTKKHRMRKVMSLTGTSGLASIARSDYLICLLPATAATKGILGPRLFAHTGADTMLINVARGHHLNVDALIDALNNQRLRRACLDVFEQEPLPGGHPLWQHDKITITPHVSALTPLDMAVSAISDSLTAIGNGKALPFLVDRDRGY